jgi:hypothetical protein
MLCLKCDEVTINTFFRQYKWMSGKMIFVLKNHNYTLSLCEVNILFQMLCRNNKKTS